ncbi:tryptophan dimethylallyltransferase [Nannizzia gypsea CBS 118893]|uniref:Tryptophan dimethylallyltransferase n=1 Tax=Arthroderma gypseum (strain ATCC MYA-4604 / CBS 118893) TaxID=535722 RepID=E4UPH2_ARTGP|nr:tryptophan dimethylallyltransferase [Nannizzia gypsea CBS 118893]EFQ99847.1 tryptophan dimethylallyltransferase [Nannizzia gypsea CBS 118893]
MAAVTMDENSGPVPSPYSVISKVTQFENFDQASWWHDVAPMAERILQHSNYSKESQYQYMLLLSQVLVPSLGPYTPSQRTWRSTITRSGVPVELSVNYRKQGQSTVRISVEPCTHLSGLPIDPFNQVPTKELMAKIAKYDFCNFDTELWDYFSSCLTVSKSEQHHIAENNIDVSVFKTQMAPGFDLSDNGEISVKGYVYPRAKATANGVPIESLVFESLQYFEKKNDCSTALAMLKEYILEKNLGSNIGFLAWDCVTPSKSRLKMYLGSADVTMGMIKDLYTIGGRLNDPTTLKGFELLTQLWKATGLAEGVRELVPYFDDPMQVPSQGQKAPVLINYEITPGSPHPVSKLYLPTHGENDLQVAKGLSEFFAQIGWTELAETYVDRLQALYPNLDLSRTSCLISWLSFAYTEKNGVYLTVYYHSSSEYMWKLEDEQK